MRSGLRYPSGNPLRRRSGRLRICLVFFFLLRREVSVVVGDSLCLVLFLGMQAVQKTSAGGGGMLLRAISTSYEMLSCISLLLNFAL